MPSRDLTMTNEVGLHARPAAVFAKAAATFECDVLVMKGDRQANAKSILAVLKLDVVKGDKIILTTEGNGAEVALEELVKVIESL